MKTFIPLSLLILVAFLFAQLNAFADSTVSVVNSNLSCTDPDILHSTLVGDLQTEDSNSIALDAAGNADAATWPATVGACYRGGAWNSGILPTFRDLAVSDRYYVGLTLELRRTTSGGRGGR